MGHRQPLVLVICLIMVMQTVKLFSAEQAGWIAGDLHFAGQNLTDYQPGPGKEILVFQDGFAVSIGQKHLSADNAVVWLESVQPESGGGRAVGYKSLLYLRGDVSLKNIKENDLQERLIEEGQALVVRFDIRGGVFVTAEKREIAEPRRSELYKEALVAAFPVQAEAPSWTAVKSEVQSSRPGDMIGKLKQSKSRYPLYYAPVGETPVNISWDKASDGTDIATIIGRIYVWQQVPVEKTGQILLLELWADEAVIFYSGQAQKALTDRSALLEDILAAGAVDTIYLSGDVIMKEGLRSIRADQMYYDFLSRRALATNVVIRTFDVSRDIPIYLRAEKLRQLAENKFAAENVTLTTSEFYLPQISLTASAIVITDTSPVDQQSGTVSDNSYDAQIRDVRFNVYDKTVFFWPGMRSNLQRPDVPIKSISTGHNSVLGSSIETRWPLARLLGLEQPQGTDSTFELDYYSNRGLGSGVEFNYAKENYFGRFLGYIIDDHGEDRLGRDASRKNLEPPRELRGRFELQHRQFLPYNWQLTTEVGYISDEHFLEQYYRDEFNTDKEQETVVHAKRLQDNWALSLLGKWRLNDFADTLEELPSTEFHWTGQSLFNDRFTFYSDSQMSRFRQRSDADGSSPLLQDFFTFMSTRNEIDLPMTFGRAKVVPFAAGTLAYDDGSGFTTELDGIPTRARDETWFGETGVRVSTQPYWKIYPDIKSRLWDVNRLRHIIQPHLTAVAYTQNDSVIEQRDTFNVGLSQRLQTKRGPADKQRTVDWMRLNVDLTWVNNSADTSGSPDQFIWNKPLIPLANTFSRRFGQSLLPPLDRRSSGVFGPTRNYLGTDYIWRVSDTTAVLSDFYYDLQSGTMQQFNIGLSRFRWPDLSYYIGSRYLRSLDNGLGEKGSNAFVFAATYELDPRYTLVFSQQFDFDYGLNIRTDVALIRQYHRLYFALTYSVDESLDEHTIAFSIWPAGMPELAIGPKRYLELGSPSTY